MPVKINFVSIDFSTCPGACQLCGKKEELRPYGPFREWICFNCGKKLEPTTTQRMKESMGGVGTVKHTIVEGK